MYMVTITSRGVSRVESKTKKAVVVTARVHPGETNGSWMMEGFLDFLLGNSEDAQLLRDTFVFKVRQRKRKVHSMTSAHFTDTICCVSFTYKVIMCLCCNFLY